MDEHEWLGVAEDQWFSVRWAIRLPNGNIWKGQYGPWMWETEDAATQAIESIQRSADEIGVGEWRGGIVRQMCTPWIGKKDNADDLIGELSAWLERQIGGEK